jgi:magnesium-transporting ATPase (P-type)
METLLCKHWHHCRSRDGADFLDTDPERGLSVFEVKHRQEKFGPNTVTVKKRTGPFVRFLNSSTSLSSTSFWLPGDHRAPSGVGVILGHPGGRPGQRRHRLHPGGQGGAGIES